MDPESPASESGVRVEIRKPISFEGVPKKGEAGSLLSRIVDALQAYRKAVDALVKDKYAVRDAAPVILDGAHQLPPHLQQPVNVFVLHCSDGVIVRYERSDKEKQRIRFAEVHSTLEDLAPKSRMDWSTFRQTERPIKHPISVRWFRSHAGTASPGLRKKS